MNNVDVADVNNISIISNLSLEIPKIILLRLSGMLSVKLYDDIEYNHYCKIIKTVCSIVTLENGLMKM